MKKYFGCLILAMAILTWLVLPAIYKKAGLNEQKRAKQEKEYFCKMEAGNKKWERKIKKFGYGEAYDTLCKEIRCFPVPAGDWENLTWDNGWRAGRKYGGSRSHEGCDLMDVHNERGAIPVVSMTGGTVAGLGWLELGGWRVGILSSSGIYYYYAHLDSYSPTLKKGGRIKPGQLLGYMGDSGYGPEGTKGKFPVHLHVGIYIKNGKQEYAVNPYYLLNMVFGEEKKIQEKNREIR